MPGHFAASRWIDALLRVAIIGAGRVGQIRAGVIRRADGAVLAAVADMDRIRAEKLAHETAAEATTDWASIVSRSDIDAVVVCTPTRFHGAIAIAALQSIKHVLCEKPLGRNVNEARSMFDAAHASGCLLKTGFNYRHMPHVRKAKELLDAGVLGSLYLLRCRYGHGGRPGYEKEWCTDAELSGGGVLLEQGIHIFDLVRHLLGEPSEIAAETNCFFWPFPVVEDNGFCLMRTSSGQVAQIHVSWTQWVNLFELEVFGHDGYLRLEGRDGSYGPPRLTWGKRKPDHGRPAEQSFQFAEAVDSWDLEWREFQSAIAEAREPTGSTSDGLRSQQLIDAAYQSASRHSWIAIPNLDSQSRKADS
jgi:predicted dehydrogenase